MNIKPLFPCNFLIVALTATLLPAHILADNLEQRVAALEKKTEKHNKVWYDTLSFSGLIELEASYSDPDSDDSQSDIVIATTELGVEARLAEDLSASMVLLYEEDEGNIDVDIATVNYTLGNGFSFVLGQKYVPFGAYNTNLSDTLGLEIGETRETTFITHYDKGSFHGAFYFFNGDNDEKGKQRINDYGARISFNHNFLTIGGDFISNLGDSDGLTDFVDYSLEDDRISGTAVFAELAFATVGIFAEYLAALDAYAPENNAKPSASQLEAFIESGDFTYAVSYQKTDEADFLDLPEKRVSAGLKTEIASRLELNIEFARDESYMNDTINHLIVRLATEF